MTYSSIDDVIKKTATILKMDEVIVRDVIAHTLLYIRKFMLNPTVAGIKLRYFGTLLGHSKWISAFISTKLIKRIRISRKESDVELLRTLWKFRRLVQQDEQRRNFKKRFNGKWHYPGYRPDGRSNSDTA